MPMVPVGATSGWRDSTTRIGLSALVITTSVIASGQGIALVPVSVARSHSRPDLVYLAVTDALPVETCLAVPENHCTGLVLGFLDLATATLRQHSGNPQGAEETRATSMAHARSTD